jgi:mRNA interferase MazF
MTTYEPGQVITIPFPFTDLTTTKKRPALIISSQSFNQSHDDLIVVAITSQKPSI